MQQRSMMNGRFVLTVLAMAKDSPSAVSWSRLWLDQANCASLSEPDLVIYISSAEAGLVALPCTGQQIAAVRRRHPSARHVFVSMACLGLHAGILEASRSRANSVLIFLIEAPLFYTQAVMDVAGLGSEGEGLVAREGAAVLHLARGDVVTKDAYGLALATILTKSKGSGGTLRLLEKLETVLAPLTAEPPGVDIVSFRIHSHWSDQLFLGFNTLIWPKWAREARLLESCEDDRQHYLTMKPLVELTNYGSAATQRPLAIITLGGGGRIGVLVLMRGQMPKGCWDRTPLSFVAARSGPYLDYPHPLYNSGAFRTDDSYFLDELALGFDPSPWQPLSCISGAANAGGEWR